MTPDEAHLLIKLAEECGELTQIAMKTLWYGYDGYHPDDPETSNATLLEDEIADVLTWIARLVEQGKVRPEVVRETLSAALASGKGLG